jgi:phytoene dehydrogenase-like protein
VSTYDPAPRYDPASEYDPASKYDPASRYDTVIIGGGHNGLVAAYYLARAGLRPLVLERRPLIGGACVTEEFAPGYRASTGAYVLSMLRPEVWRDMDLVRRGVVVDPAGPGLTVLPDGANLHLHDETGSTVDEIARHSRRDARAFPEFEAGLARLTDVLLPTFDWPGPDLSVRHWRDAVGLARLGRLAVEHRRRLAETLALLTTSVADYLDERFESDIVKAALGWHAINDSTAGPSTAGTGFVLLHDHASGDPGGGVRQWGFVRGGMGRVTLAMADAAREAGAVIRVDAPVAHITCVGQRAVGVVLEDGEEIAADRVVSNADPKRTFLGLCRPEDLPGEFVRSMEAFRSEGTSIKINLAVAELPKLAGRVSGLATGPGSGDVQAYHRGIMEIGPPLATLDVQQAEARHGVAASGSHIELCVPTVHDPSLAPEGRHIVTIDVNSQPYHLANGSWDDRRDEVADRVVKELGELMPNLPGSILHRQVLTPVDLERTLGLTGGHALHGEMSLDQLFFLRPARGWADYRTPIDGLYLCGAGTHPGGGVTGANGRNCAREVLRDARRRNVRGRRSR